MSAIDPGPVLVETQTLHDGEPMHWWEWGETPNGLANPSRPERTTEIDS